MPDFPQLTTARLLLRGFDEADAGAVQRLAGDRRVADTTALIPHPYPDGAAESWIATHEATWIMRRGLVLAVTLRATGDLIGAIGLQLDPDNCVGELGYWIGVPYWRRGYCTEAAAAVLDYGFRTLKLHRVEARHFARNPASGRVLEKIGMTFEGCRREAVRKAGRFEDVRYHGILRAEWRARQTTRR